MPVPAKILRKNKPLEVTKDGTKIWARNEKGQPICYARKSSESGRANKERCSSIFVIAPTGRCKFHGGMTRRGIAHQKFKHGKYSTAIPKNLREEFHQYLADPDYLSLREDIAITKALIKEILEGIHESIDGRSLNNYYRIARKMEKAIQCEDAMTELVELRKLARQLIELINAGKDSVAYQTQLQNSQKHLKELIDVERKRLESGYRQITVETVMGLVMMMTKALTEVVTDPKQLTKVTMQWDGILRQQDIGTLPSHYTETEEEESLSEIERFPDYPDEDE